MSTALWPSSPLDAAQRAFELLVCQPAPLAFDTRPFAGLPDEILPLDELRDLLLLPPTGVPARDAVWRELVTRARRDGPAWVVAVVGMALPGLRRMAGLLAGGWRGDTADLDAELLVGFVERLKTVDLDEPRICGRLIDAGVRAARKVRDRYSDTQLIRTDSAESRLPMVPWDHPDLVLARAVAAGVLEPEEAVLIGATRLGRATLAQAGAPLDMDPAQAGAMRRRAELRLRDAIHAGELDYVPIRRRRAPNSRRRGGAVGSLLGSSPVDTVGFGTQHGPLVGKRSAGPAAGFGAPGIGTAPAV
jgi:hypothetical protein